MWKGPGWRVVGKVSLIIGHVGKSLKKRERGSRVLDLERMLQAEESVCAKALR